MNSLTIFLTFFTVAGPPVFLNEQAVTYRGRPAPYWVDQLAADNPPDLSEVHTILSAIESLGPEAAEAVLLLLPLLNHEDEFTRVRTIRALGSIDSQSEAAVPQLRELIRVNVSEDLPPSRYAMGIEAARAIWLITGSEQEALPVIVRQGPQYRAAIGELAVELGPEDNPLVPLLAEILRDNYRGKGHTGNAIGDALVKLGPSVIPSSGHGRSDGFYRRSRFKVG